MNDEIKLTKATIITLREALERIALYGGNLSEDRLTSRTGPNDAVARGLMYVSARRDAEQALTALDDAVKAA